MILFPTGGFSKCLFAAIQLFTTSLVSPQGYTYPRKLCGAGYLSLSIVGVAAGPVFVACPLGPLFSGGEAMFLVILVVSARVYLFVGFRCKPASPLYRYCVGAKKQ